jgi:hypothetical protein
MTVPKLLKTTFVAAREGLQGQKKAQLAGPTLFGEGAPGEIFAHINSANCLLQRHGLMLAQVSKVSITAIASSLNAIVLPL